MNKFTLVTVDNFHEIIPKYISENKIIISEYEDMTNVVLHMIRAKFFFNFDKNVLRGFMEDLTYMYSPDDDLNKDRIINMLESSDDEDECLDDDVRINYENKECETNDNCDDHHDDHDDHDDNCE